MERFVKTQSFRYRGKSRKNAKSPIQGKACKTKSPIQRKNRNNSSSQHMGKFNLKKNKVSNTRENRKKAKFPMWVNSWKFKVPSIGGKFVNIQSTHYMGNLVKKNRVFNAWEKIKTHIPQCMVKSVKAQSPQYRRKVYENSKSPVHGKTDKKTKSSVQGGSL